MAESKKGHNFAIQGPTEKKIRVRLFFCTDAIYKFQVPSSSGALVLQPTKGVTDRRTGPNQYAPPNFFEIGGIKIVSRRMPFAYLHKLFIKSFIYIYHFYFFSHISASFQTG